MLEWLRRWLRGNPPQPSKPRERHPHPGNVPGPVYVEDGCCAGCNAWQDVAGDYLRWNNDDAGGHCHVYRQPASDTEFEAIVAAMKIQEIDCIRLRGGPAQWRERLVSEGQGHFIDD